MRTPEAAFWTVIFGIGWLTLWLKAGGVVTIGVFLMLLGGVQFLTRKEKEQ
jgi:hypothetical protein